MLAKPRKLLRGSSPLTKCGLAEIGRRLCAGDPLTVHLICERSLLLRGPDALRELLLPEALNGLTVVHTSPQPLLAERSLLL